MRRFWRFEITASRQLSASDHKRHILQSDYYSPKTASQISAWMRAEPSAGRPRSKGLEDNWRNCGILGIRITEGRSYESQKNIRQKGDDGEITTQGIEFARGREATRA